MVEDTYRFKPLRITLADHHLYRTDSAQAMDTSSLVSNFLQSLNPSGRTSQQYEQPYTTLADLLSPADTIPFLDHASEEQINSLCAGLPRELFEDEVDGNNTSQDSSNLLLSRKRAVVTRVLRSPQLQQSLGSLTIALRDGGLPMIGESLGVQVNNGGFMHGTSMPLGGNNAVKAFVEGVKDTVQKEQSEEDNEDRPRDS